MTEVMILLGNGLLQAFEPLNLFMIFAGCLAGLLLARCLAWDRLMVSPFCCQ